MDYQQLRVALPVALWSAVTLFTPLPAMAHHSFATFDETRTRTLEGAVKTFQWANPHVLLKVLVKVDDRSEPQEWSIESSSPAILTRFGWRRNSIKRGDRVSVICDPLRDGSHGGHLHTLIMLDTGQALKTKLSASTDIAPK
jgi:hypothetical protein